MPLLVLTLPAHGRVGLFLTPPPGRDDSAPYRWMGLRDETFGRGDMCDQVIHGWSVLLHSAALQTREGGLTKPPSSSP